MRRTRRVRRSSPSRRSLLEDLKKDAGEYRQKDIFDARAFNTTRIEIARGGETAGVREDDR